MRLLRCLVVSLLAYPVMALAASPEPGARAADVSQAAPAASSAQPATPATEAAQAQRALLEQRVAAKWDALIRKDFEAAYAFTSPSYRKLYSLNSFMSNFGAAADWRRIEVIDVDFKGDDAATVGINIQFVHSNPQTGKPLDMKTYVKEPWVRVDGQWWYVMKE